MLLQPFPTDTHSPDEKVEPLTGRTNAQDFRFIPLDWSCPWIRPAMPLAGHGLLRKTAETRGYAYPKDQGTRYRQGKEPLATGERPTNDQSCSFRAFFRLRLRASASFTRFFSPGFR